MFISGNWKIKNNNAINIGILNSSNTGAGDDQITSTGELGKFNWSGTHFNAGDGDDTISLLGGSYPGLHSYGNWYYTTDYIYAISNNYL